MIDVTRTTSALLESLRDADNNAAWTELDGRYRPIIASLARRAGLDDDAAADVSQECLTDFFRAYRDHRYDRSRGRLRQFLLGIARLKIADAHRARARGGGAVRLETSLPPETDEAQWTSAWEAEQRAGVLRQALQELRASDRLASDTLNAFEMVAIQAIPAAEVARTLGLSTQEVYLAKSRCLDRMRTLIQRLEAAYEGE